MDIKSDELLANGGENVAGEEEEEEEEEEEVDVDQELRTLFADADDMVTRYTKQEKRFSGKEGVASAADISEVYRILSTDILPLVRDLIAATGAAVTNVAQLSFGEEEDEGSEEGDEEIDEDTLQIYSTLTANANAFAQFLDTPGIDAKVKEGLKGLLELNQASISIFDEQLGREKLKSTIEEKLKAVGADAQRDN